MHPVKFYKEAWVTSKTKLFYSAAKSAYFISYFWYGRNSIHSLQIQLTQIWGMALSKLY